MTYIVILMSFQAFSSLNYAVYYRFEILTAPCKRGINIALAKRHISILSTRDVIWTFFGTTPSPLEKSRAFLDSAGAPEVLFIVQALRLSTVYKSIKVHLWQGRT